MTSINEIIDLDIEDLAGSIWLDLYDQHSISSSPAVKYPEVTPNYRIVPSLRNPNIEPGDTIELDLFVSGYGMPKLNRLSIFGSIEEIFEVKEDSIRIIPNVSGVIEAGDIDSIVRGPPSRELGLVNKRSFNGFPVSTPLPRIVFADEPGLQGDRKDYSPHAYPNVVGESFVYNGSALRVEIDTKDADWYSRSWYSGEYPIQIVFMYGDDKNGKITKEEIPVEVRTRGNKFWWLTAIIAITAALTFIIRFLFEPILNLLQSMI